MAKFYSVEDIEKARDVLKSKVKEKYSNKEVIEMLKNEIIDLYKNKGYSKRDIILILNENNIKVSTDILNKIFVDTPKKRQKKNSDNVDDKTDKTID